MKCLAFIAVFVCALVADQAKSQHDQIVLSVTHTFNESDDPSSFPVLIDRPPEFDPTTDHAVVLFHGGHLSDPHWTVPGSYSHEGEEVLITIDGQPTQDADRIAEALLGAGYAVIRYGSIHTDPWEREPASHPRPISFPQTVVLAGLVWEMALSELQIDAERCITLGHSLGAARAVLTGSDAAGHVLLAGAYITPTMSSPHQLTRDAEHSDEVLDYDGSGSIEPFESAAFQAIATNQTNTHPQLLNNNHSYTWPSTLLIESEARIYAIWGSLDSISYHGPVLEHLFEHANTRSQLTTRYFQNRGHNLSAEESNRVDQIDPRVVDSIVDWLNKNFPNG